MNDIRLVLADLDGTVVQPEAHAASTDAVDAIREAKDQGVKFAAITGRPYWMAQELLESIGFNGSCVFEGGAVIIDIASDEILWSKSVPVETTRLCVSILSKKASIMEFGQGVINASDSVLSNITEAALSIWASVPVGDVEELIAELEELPEIAVHANNGPGGDFTRAGIQVTHFEADKEHAVKELLKLSKIDKSHTLAIGDGDNDIPLFRGAKLKIAMGNASDLLKSHADEVVPTVDNEGFAYAIRKFVT